MAARLKEKYTNEVFQALNDKFHYANVMEVPKLEKITLNMGLGDCKDNPKLLEMAVAEMAAIAGQAPVVTKSRKSIANFKLRAGMSVGCKVTLRGDRMYEFADKFFTIALPRVRDFKGVSKNSFDGRGNYALGVKEQLIFPEIEYDKVEKIRGMDIVFTTTAKTDEEASLFKKVRHLPYLLQRTGLQRGDPRRKEGQLVIEEGGTSNMTMTDPVADMLTRIRNANTAGHATVDIPASKIKKNIAEILVKEGYIKGYEVVAGETQDIIRVTMKYGPEKTKVISGIKKISKPGLKVYAKANEVPKVLGGLGIAIISTSSGLVTDKEARKLGVGGEVICYVW